MSRERTVELDVRSTAASEAAKLDLSRLFRLLTVPVHAPRRALLQRLAALGVALAVRPAWPAAGELPLSAADFCGSGGRGRRLWVPGDDGYLGRLSPGERPVTLLASATRSPSAAVSRGPLGYATRTRRRHYTNPTIVLQRGQRVRVNLVNALAQPTIVHWHGLAVDGNNDGNGSFLVKPGGRYAYDFEVRNRSGMYWYHPHPHGLTAAQTYGGLYGAVMVEDDDERALRAALDLVPGRAEIPLIMQDRGPDTYRATPHDMTHGLVGSDLYVNGTKCPYLDVGSRIYRFRMLNAANARTLLIAFRTAKGALLPFTLIGNDGGLLPAPMRCERAFLATAERIDVLLDLRDAAVGDSILLQTLAFDAMHLEMAHAAPADPHAGHATPTDAHAGHSPPADPHAAHAHSAGMHLPASAWPDGAPRALLELRVRQRIAFDRAIPERLSTLPPIAASSVAERTFRLGFADGRWRINDRVFEMGMPPIEVQRGKVETWLIRNDPSSMPHAMHLHGFPFEVLGREKSPGGVAALEIDPQGRVATDLGRKDTVLVWPGESVRIGVDFAHPYAGPQAYLFHCHNLEHEDGGMMVPVAVV